MSSTHSLFRTIAVAFVGLAVLAGGHAGADEVKGKWRIDLHVGATDPGDSIESDSNNVQTIRAEDGSSISFFDPRPTNVKDARLDAEAYVEMRAGYGLSAWKNGEIILDVGIGRFVSDIDDVELSFKWDSQRASASYTNVLVNAGSLETWPVSVGLLARYRPTKRFNPYIGASAGYMFNELSLSNEWREIADYFDQSVVAYVERVPGDLVTERRLADDPDNNIVIYRNTNYFRDRPDLEDLYEFVRGTTDTDGDGTPDCAEGGIGNGASCYRAAGHDVERPRIEVSDTFYIEARGGAEWQWRPKIAIFGEVRFSWAAQNIEITTDGRQKFGESVGDGTFTAENAPAPPGGRPAYVLLGGLPGSFAETPTQAGPQPGQYFLQGGVLDYGGFTFTAGLRFEL
jgi:hypothetical protein